jgi:hypothetical protein
MALESQFLKASYSSALPRSLALAIALIVPALPARAEVVTLICQQEQLPGNSLWGDSFTLRIDYDRKIVDWLRSNGTALLSATATITEADVQWGDRAEISKGDKFFSGSLNRLSGQGRVYFKHLEQNSSYTMSGPCRRATQKF